MRAARRCFSGDVLDCRLAPPGTWLLPDVVPLPSLSLAGDGDVLCTGIDSDLCGDRLLRVVAGLPAPGPRRAGRVAPPCAGAAGRAFTTTRLLSHVTRVEVPAPRAGSVAAPASSGLASLAPPPGTGKSPLPLLVFLDLLRRGGRWCAAARWCL